MKTEKKGNGMPVGQQLRAQTLGSEALEKYREGRNHHKTE